MWFPVPLGYSTLRALLPDQPGVSCGASGIIVIRISFAHSFFSDLFCVFRLRYCREVFRVLLRIYHKPILVDIFLPAINDPDQRQLVQDGTGV